MNYSKLLTSVYDCLSLCKSGIRHLFVLLIFFQLYLVNPGRASDGFRAAIVKVDITPEDPQMMAGYGALLWNCFLRFPMKFGIALHSLLLSISATPTDICVIW